MLGTSDVWKKELDKDGKENMVLLSSDPGQGVPAPGDKRVSALFGALGTEAIIRVTLKHINLLRDKQGLAELTYDEFITEISGKSEEITNQHGV